MGFERRRQTDRRNSPRGGKYERRRNTCERCHFYKPQSTIAGVCQKHQTMIKGSDFACTSFTPLLHPAPEQE